MDNMKRSNKNKKSLILKIARRNKLIRQAQLTLSNMKVDSHVK